MNPQHEAAGLCHFRRRSAAVESSGNGGPIGLCWGGQTGRVRRVRVLLMGMVLGAWAMGAAAQELTPRAYWPAPKGTGVAVLGYTYVSGDVLFDRSTPLYGVDSRINVGIVAYLQTFSLWKRTTNVLVERFDLAFSEPRALVPPLAPVPHLPRTVPRHPLEAGRWAHDAARQALHRGLILRLHPHPIVTWRPGCPFSLSWWLPL
jgi:hypothetical protein